MFLVLCSFNRHGVRRTSHSRTQNYIAAKRKKRRGGMIRRTVHPRCWGKIKHSLATKTETEMGRDHNVALYYGTTTIAFPLCIVLCPAPPCTCEKGGSGVLNDFPCHSSPTRELKPDYRTSLSTRPSMPVVRCMCTGNAIITSFTPFNPTPCDKKCPSEHQTLFPLSGGGVWGRDYAVYPACGMVP